MNLSPPCLFFVKKQGGDEDEGRYIYFKIKYQLWKLAEESF